MPVCTQLKKVQEERLSLRKKSFVHSVMVSLLLILSSVVQTYEFHEHLFTAVGIYQLKG